MKVLCDTNILIEYYKANSLVLQQLKQIGASNIAISVIRKAESFYSRYSTIPSWVSLVAA